jgi:glutamate/tyrosine decarboxylase-like PLP-dependent enzyme
VWLALRQVGRIGAIGMIADDMRLSQHLDALVRRHPEFEVFTQQLSITTFRYVPSELKPQIGSSAVEKRIDEINQALLTRVEKSGEAFLSNAVVNGKFALRACVVNFRTSLIDIEALPPLLSRLGKDVSRDSGVGLGSSPADRP